MAVDEPILVFRGEYFFLSNFYRNWFRYKGRLWPTAEHAFQAMKSVDEKVWDQILKLSTPGEAKGFGQTIVLRPKWDVFRVPFMHEVVRAKFQVPGLRGMLLATGNSRLSEGNWHGDEFWGVNLRTGKGQDRLGLILMRVRQEIRDAG